MARVAALLLVLGLAVTATAHEISPSEPGGPPRLLPSVAELATRLGEPRTPEGLTLADLQAEIDRLNQLWGDARGREEALIAQVADVRIAALPQGDSGVVGLPLPGDAIARRMLMSSDGVQRAVDLRAGESAELDLVREELAVVRGLGDQLVHRWFTRPVAAPPDDPPLPPPQQLRCNCKVSTGATSPGGTPPACAGSWGMNYSVQPGICDWGTCSGPVPCSGTMTVFMHNAPGQPCTWGMTVDSPPGETVWNSTGINSWSVSVNLACGHHVTLHWEAEGVNLGTTTLRCETCLSPAPFPF